MGYMHIDNLYKNTELMLFKECYVLEKIHGTSAWITLEEGKIQYHSGGSKQAIFVSLFNEEELLKVYKENFTGKVKIHGEAYGGKEQGMSATYGKKPKFVVFDVMIGDCWLNVPNAEDVTKKFGLEFVAYAKVSTDLEELNLYRDASSVQADRNGCGTDKKREGIVIRPLIELTRNDGKRIIAKHKGDEFKETNTAREVNPEKLKILEEAKAIADEWVTPMRLTHVLDKLGNPNEIEKTGTVIKAMIQDVLREAEGEIVVSKECTHAIGKATALLYKKKVSFNKDEVQE